ncbi:MAG: FtsX-like permease family protein [Acidimicrobiales bacterium]|nr:FtsX-like permease family protein [Acidimicrobiales bacterium]
MLELALKGVRHNGGRYVATLVAIITGVAFFAASGFVSRGVIDALEGDAARQYEAVDAAVLVDPDGNGDVAEDLRIDQGVYDQIAALDEVDGVAGDLTGAVAFLGDDGRSTFGESTGQLWVADEELNPLDVVDGAAPEASGEIAVDRATADGEGIAVGDQLTLLTLAGPQEVTVVGVTAFGDSDNAGGPTVSISDADAFDWLNAGQVEYVDLFIRGSVDQADLVAAIEPLVPDGFQAQTGEEFIADQQSQAGGFGRVLKVGLQGFAVLALFVGAFVIYNTFNVIVAQRQRELAVLSAIGATPRQIKRSLRLEGLVIGVVGSALGVAIGFALGFVLVWVLDAVGVSLPGGGIGIDVPTIVQGMLFGTIITYLSVMIPARRAAKVEPIEALRQSAAETGTVSRGRKIVVGALIGFGAAGMLFGGQAGNIAISALMLIVGVILAGPVVAIVGSRLMAPVLGRFGLEGRLAADNSARNPQRTATTANALLIGLFLVTLVTVAGTSVKDFARAEISSLSGADFVISSEGGTVDDALVSDLEAIGDVERVISFRREAVAQDGEPAAISTGDLDAMVDAASLEVQQGSFDDLTGDTIVVIDAADGTGPDVGDTVTLTNSVGDTLDVEVVGIVGSTLDTSLTGSFLPTDTFDAFVGETAPTAAFIDVASGAQSEVEDEIAAITDQRPDITLVSGDQIGQLVGSVFEFLINAVNGLLLMSVVVALIGIVNTLSLSILERRRELGLLRVVGMVDRRVQRMVRLESVLISALGTVTGVALGLFTGWALIFSIDRLSDAEIAFAFPAARLALVVVLGIGLGLAASWIPARRSTRLDVLDALDAT